VHKTKNGADFECNVTLDDTKNPKFIDLTIVKSHGANATDKDEAGKILPGIYALEGDRLKLCLGVTSRPASFDGRGEDTVLLVLERAK
jgi:uncharacterized protein (TIGR03067 family)